MEVVAWWNLGASLINEWLLRTRLQTIIFTTRLYERMFLNGIITGQCCKWKLFLVSTAYYYLPNVARDVDHRGETQRELKDVSEAYILHTRACMDGTDQY